MYSRLAFPKPNRELFDSYAHKIFSSGCFTQGECTAALAQQFSDLLGVEHISLCSNGTTALTIALSTLGLKPGSGILTTPYSFVATANSISLAGHKPIFIDHKGPTITSEDLLNFISTRLDEINGGLFYRDSNGACIQVSALVPVDQFGIPLDLTSLLHVTNQYGIQIVRDAACLLGTQKVSLESDCRYFNDNERSIFTVFSLHPRKTITSGEGGIIVSPSLELKILVDQLINHGLPPVNRAGGSHLVSSNSRISELQAALALSHLPSLDEIVRRRNISLSLYADLLSSHITLVRPADPSILWNVQTLCINLHGSSSNASIAIRYLNSFGICAKLAITPITDLKPYTTRDTFSRISQYAYNTITIPCHEHLADSDVEFVCSKLNDYLDKLE